MAAIPVPGSGRLAGRKSAAHWGSPYLQLSWSRSGRASITLRQFGFPLSQVAEVLAEPEWELLPAIKHHLVEARRRAALASSLCARLAAMTDELAQQEHPSPQELFATVEEMLIIDGTVHGTTGL